MRKRETRCDVTPEKRLKAVQELVTNPQYTTAIFLDLFLKRRFNNLMQIFSKFRFIYLTIIFSLTQILSE